MSKHETSATLNSLLETTMSGEKDFVDAARHAHSPKLKALFAAYAADCARSVNELSNCITELGDSPSTGGTTTGALHRTWINLKVSVNSDNDLTLLEACARGEDHAKAQYRVAMKSEILSPSIRSLLQRQYDGTVVHHDRIRDLRNEHRRVTAV